MSVSPHHRLAICALAQLGRVVVRAVWKATEAKRELARMAGWRESAGGRGSNVLIS